jgi:hypothetical protein
MNMENLTNTKKFYWAMGSGEGYFSFNTKEECDAWITGGHWINNPFSKTGKSWSRTNVSSLTVLEEFNSSIFADELRNRNQT